MADARERPWWRQLRGLPPGMDRRRTELLTATAGMTRREVRRYQFEQVRRWIWAHRRITLTVLVVMTLVDAVQTVRIIVDSSGWSLVLALAFRAVMVSLLAGFWWLYATADRAAASDTTGA